MAVQDHLGSQEPAGQVLLLYTLAGIKTNQKQIKIAGKLPE